MMKILVTVYPRYYSLGWKWLFVLMNDETMICEGTEYTTREAMTKIKEYSEYSSYEFLRVCRNEEDAIMDLMREHIRRCSVFGGVRHLCKEVSIDESKAQKEDFESFFKFGRAGGSEDSSRA